MFLHFSTLVYVEMGQGSTDTATLAFAFTGSSTARTWEIKATQIPCGASYRPPDGCLQYHTTLSGRFQTFNFAETTTASQVHLLAQKYLFLYLTYMVSSFDIQYGHKLGIICIITWLSCNNLTFFKKNCQMTAIFSQN